MTKTLRTAPFGMKYRELWLPEQINALSLPPAVFDGHALTLASGATKRTTSDGVRFTGAATSYIDCGAIYNAGGTLWFSFRFRLDQTFTTGVKYLMQKMADATHYMEITLGNTGDEDGKVHFVHNQAGELFDLEVGTGTLLANTWYHVLASISAANGARLRLDGGTAQVNADVTAAPNGGNVVFGNQTTPSTSGFVGDLTDIFMGTTDLVAATTELDIVKGIPPTTTYTSYYPLDEGRGTTATDLGTTASNGTLGAACTWRWGKVYRNCIGFDAINAIASSASVRASKAITLVAVLKAKCTYNALSSTHTHLMITSITEATASQSFHYLQSSDALRLLFGSASVTSAYKPAIDEYLILMGTFTDALLATFSINGSPVGSATSTTRTGNATTTIRLGTDASAGRFDISKHLFEAIIEGAMTNAQGRNYCHMLNDELGLGVTIG